MIGTKAFWRFLGRFSELFPKRLLRQFLFNLTAMVCLFSSGAFAQGGNEEIIVTATQGVSWDQVQKVYTAQGDAAVKQGDFEVYGQLLQAFYRDDESPSSNEAGLSEAGSGTIYRIVAEKSVYAKINKDELAAGRLDYNVDTEIVVATGEEPIYAAEGGILVQAKDRLVYDPKNRRAQAVGKVRAQDGDLRVNADLMTLIFREPENPDDRPSEIDHVIAEGNVIVVQDKDTAQADIVVYYPDQELARLSGNVVIVQANGNVAQGAYGSFDFASGLGQILATTPESNSRPGKNKRVFIKIKPGRAPR